MIVERTWMHGDHVIFKFQGIDTISDAERLAGRDVSIPESERPAPAEGEYYLSDLVGCEVFDERGRLLGSVADWQETGGPVLIELLGADGKELLIPFAKSIFAKIDLAARRIQVTLPEGLADLN